MQYTKPVVLKAETVQAAKCGDDLVVDHAAKIRLKPKGCRLFSLCPFSFICNENF